MSAAASCDPQTQSSQSSGRSAGIVFRKGFWAIADQGLFAGSNFVVNIMLARWLTPNQYGAFATAFAAFLALGVIHTALLTEPMLVFSPDRYRDQHKQYFGSLLWGHIIVSLAASLVLAISGWILSLNRLHDLASAMYAFAAAAPFILFLWLMRRTCYGQLNPKRSAIGGAVYLILMMSALAFVHATGRLSINTSLEMIALSSLIVGIALGIGQVDLHPTPALMRDVLAEHLRYGRWATATQILGFIPGNIYYFLLPQVGSLADSGAPAMTNLFMPLMQANSALFLLLLPAFVRTRGTPEGKRLHRWSLGVLAGGPLIYWIILGLFNHQVVELVYGGKYHQYSGLLWLIGMQPVIAGMCGVYGSLLRARQQLDAVLWGGVVSALGAVTLGIAFTHWFGLTGVCWSIAITYALHHITLWLFSRIGNRDTRQTSRPLRVLFLHRDLPSHGGVPRCILSLARASQRQRIKIHVASFVDPSDEMKKEFGELGIEPSAVGDRGYLSPSRQLRKLIEQNDLDVIVATSFKAYLCAKLAARKRNVGVVFWHHAIGGTSEGFIRRAIRNAIGKHDPMLFVSHAVRDLYLSPRHLGPAEVIYNGVEDAGSPYDREMRPTLGVPTDSLVLAFIGEFVPWKDHKTAIEAMHDLAWRGVPAHLLLIGSGRDLEAARTLATGGPAANRIHFLGARPDARQILGVVDIYIHPGRGEGFGLAVVEAMLAARPVIAARDGALVEIIDPGRTGLHFNPGQPWDLADAIVKLAADPDLAKKIGLAARQSCLERFSTEHFADKITAFLEKSFASALPQPEAKPQLVGDLCAS